MRDLLDWDRDAHYAEADRQISVRAIAHLAAIDQLLAARRENDQHEEKTS